MTGDYVIIVAGGKGQRMGSAVPKQFLAIGGMPVLMRTIKCFRKYSEALGIIVALPYEQHDYWRELCQRYEFDEPCQIADGGATRFHSVKNALALVPDNSTGVVGVHDGVRPFPSQRVIAKCFETARRHGAAIPVVHVAESMRRMEGKGSTTVDRNDYRIVQTPQAFGAQILKEAYRQDYSERFTDDATVVEALGQEITLVDGNRENIKLTTPFDLQVAEAIIEGQR